MRSRVRIDGAAWATWSKTAATSGPVIGSAEVASWDGSITEGRACARHYPMGHAVAWAVQDEIPDDSDAMRLSESAARSERTPGLRPGQKRRLRDRPGLHPSAGAPRRRRTGTYAGPRGAPRRTRP